jgi:hypothetical protein
VEAPSHLWVHVFLHSLGPIPKAWYIHEEARIHMNYWKTLQEQFCKDLSFTSKCPELNTVLQRIREILFTKICEKRSSLVVCIDHVQFLQSSLSLEIDKIIVPCFKVEKDLEKPNDLKELRNLDIKETEGSREIQDIVPSHTCSSYNHPLKLWKVNIGSADNPKIASIGD